MSSHPAVSARAVDLKTEFQRLAQAFATAFNRRDFDAVGSFYTPDATVMPPHHELVQGAVNVPMLLRQLEQMGAHDLRLEVTHAEQHGDMAMELGRYSMVLRRPDNTSVVDRGKYLSVRRRLPNNEWRIYADAWNSDMPPVT